jgi:hypothetical protein
MKENDMDAYIYDSGVARVTGVTQIGPVMDQTLIGAPFNDRVSWATMHGNTMAWDPAAGETTSFGKVVEAQAHKRRRRGHSVDWWRGCQVGMFWGFLAGILAVVAGLWLGTMAGQ